MDLTVVSEICIPFILFLRFFQFFLYKKCNNYLDPDKKLYKQMKRSLIPAYIEAIKTYMAIRYKKRKEIKEEDISYLEKMWHDFSLKKVEDIKDLHNIVEKLIDKMDGRPETVFRSTEDWETEFNESNEKFYESCSKIYEIKSKKPLIDTINCNCWILFSISIAAILVTIGLIESSIEYSIFSIDIILIPFFFAIFSLITLVYYLIKLILVLKKLQRVFNDARQYTI